MENYKPSLPDDSVNVAKESPLKILATGVVGVALIVGALMLLSELAVWGLIRWVPDSLERQLSRFQSSEELSKSSQSPEQKSVQTLVNRLAAHAKLPYDSIPVVVIECGHINAFAMPGGTLKICSELLEKVTDERQRAMVLGHELGHLKHRDFLKRLGRGLVFGVGLAMMFGDNSTVRGFIGHTGNLSGLKFSREEEYAADAYGLELVIAEFGDAGTAIEFYDHLSDFSVGGRFAEFVSTHPFSSNRMERLRTLSKELKVTP